MEQIIFAYGDQDCFFWSTQASAELDLLIMKHGKRIGIEIKYTDAPKITKSMRVALEDLKLDYLIIVYPGNETYPLDKDITVQGLESFSESKMMKKL